LDLANVNFPSSSVLQVFRPDGVQVVNLGVPTGPAGLGTRIQGPTQAGTYTVVVIPPADGTGNLQMTLWSDVSDTLTIGTPYSLTIQFRNQQARLPFNGATGQSLRIILSGVTLPAGGGLTVVRPDGVAVVNTSFGAAGITADIPTLTSTGIHTVQIIPGGSGTGNAVVNVLNR